MYDPKLRDDRGAFPLAETPGAHDSDEEAMIPVYAEVATEMLRASGVERLSLRDLDLQGGTGSVALPLEEGLSLGVDELGPYFEAVLRERFWGRFEGEEAFVHFGFDYCMYVGLPSACSRLLTDSARAKGIFIEQFTSPYHRDDS